MSKNEIEVPDSERDKNTKEESLTSEQGQENRTEEDVNGDGQEEEDDPAVLLEKEKEKFLRLFAEFENYKKRTSRERIDLFRTAGQEVIQAMLPVLDDFDRALAEMRKAGADQWLEGVELISQKFREVLKQKGLEPLEVQAGDEFDSEIHDAVTQIPAPEERLKGKIIDVIESGYRLGDKIIRHPKVVVGQ